MGNVTRILKIPNVAQVLKPVVENIINYKSRIINKSYKKSGLNRQNTEHLEVPLCEGQQENEDLYKKFSATGGKTL